MLPQNIKIKENSWRAELAAKVMKAYSVAIVFGDTIHLFNISKKEFLNDRKLVKHELKHVEQYERFGYFSFLVKYLWLSYKHGYYNNPLEIEAREAEGQ